MKYIYIIITFLVFSVCASAQIGVNLETVAADFHMLSGGNTSSTEALKITNSGNVDIVSVKDNGYVGIGNAAPKVKLDLRSASLGQENTLGIGYADLSATDAKAGAIRYVNGSPTSQIQFSDGKNWYTLQNIPIKAFLIAQNSSRQSLLNASASAITNWSVVKDVNANFNPVTGIFTVQRAGIYTVTASMTFDFNWVNANTQYELQLYGSTQYVSLIPYLATTKDIYLSNYCKGVFYLQANQVIRVAIYQNTGYTQRLMEDGALNTLTIAEM